MNRWLWLKQKINPLLLENILSLFTIKGSQYLLGLITVPYLVRVLGPAKFGLIAFAQGVSQYALILVNYGFDFSGVKALAGIKDNVGRGKLFAAITCWKLVFLILVSCLYCALLLAWPRFRSEIAVYLAVFLNVIGTAFFPFWFFQGLEQMRYITYVNLLGRSISVVLIFLLVKTEQDYVVAAALQSFTTPLAALFSAYFLWGQHRYVFTLPDKISLRQTLHAGWYVFLSNAFISFYTTSSTVVLGLLTSDSIVGYYSGADKIIKSLQGLLQPVTTALFPHINRLVVSSKLKALAFLRSCLYYLGGIFFVCSLLLFLGAEPVVALLLGKNFGPSVLLVRIMAPLPFIVALSNIFAIQTLLPFGLEKAYSRLYLLAGVLNLVLIGPLTAYGSAVGTAVTVLITEIFVVLSALLIIHRKGLCYRASD